MAILYAKSKRRLSSGDRRQRVSRRPACAVRAYSLVLRDYDFNFSGTFTIKERVYALQDANFNTTALVMEETQTGDTDGNGIVDISDLNKVTSHWHEYVTGGDEMGDLNHDGYVDQADEDLVTNNWHSTGTMTWAVVARNVYDPYGKYQSYNADWTVNSVNFLAWNVTYQGGMQDQVTGNINFENRDYNPRTMAWNTQDPLGYVNGPDVYQFVEDNPINKKDRTWNDVWNRNSDRAQERLEAILNALALGSEEALSNALAGIPELDTGVAHRSWREQMIAAHGA